MGTLAYDPERLVLLATSLGTAAEALELLHGGDPEAHPALAVAANAARAFAAWRSRIATVIGCSALDGYTPVQLEPTRLPDATAYVLTSLYGWRATTDPAGTRAFVPPAMRGASIGHLISQGQLAAATPEDAAALRAELDLVMLDPAARAAFAANLTPAAAALFADQLAMRRADAVWQGGGPDRTGLVGNDERRGQAADIDAIARAIANTMIRADASVGTARAILAAVRPYTAALLVGQLDRNDRLVGDLALDTLLRYRDSFADADLLPFDWEVRDRLFLGPADLLFPRISSGDADVANEFVAAVIGHDPTLLLVTAHQPSVTADLLLRATDPAAVSAGDAGQVLVPYLDLVRDQPVSVWMPAGFRAGQMEASTLLPTLGTLIAPWLVQFKGRTDDWPWTGREAADAFRFVIDDDTAFHDLRAAADRWGDGMVLLDVASPRELLQNLNELATTAGTIRGLLNRRGGREIAEDRIPWDFVVAYLPKVASKGVGKAGLTGIPAKAATKVAAFAIARGATFAEEHRLAGAPPPLEDALRELDLADDQANAVGAYVAMGLMVEMLKADGALPADTDWPRAPDVDSPCPTDVYFADSERWLEETFGGDDPIRSLIAEARGTFISGSQSATACVQLAPV